MMQKAEDRFAKLVGIQRVKMVEKGGRKLSQLLIQKDPWKNEACGREKCLPCRNDDEKKKGDCQKESITYRMKCEGCKESGKEAHYIGESSRTMFKRGGEHEEALKNKEEESPLWTHCLQYHNGVPQKFSMELIKSHQTSFDRQVTEAVFINTEEAEITMNRKSEWNGETIPRLVVEVKDEVKQKDY